MGTRDSLTGVTKPKQRTLTRRELNRALLARQLLAERARTTLPAALERVGGIQAQYAPSMYVGLWSRVEGFERDQLSKALQRGSVVQGTLMRSTIHLVSRRDYWPFAVAVRRARRQWWLRATRGNPPEAEMERAADRLRRRLTQGPVERRELDEIAGKGRAVAIGLWVDMVRMPPSGTWERRRADLFGAAEEWVGPEDVAEEDAVIHLIRRYLAGFGPASRKDVADFTGLPMRDLAAALERLPLRRFRDGGGGHLLDLPRAQLPSAEAGVPVRFLPTWDATLLVHARRTGILPERHRPRVFNTKTPHSVQTFLVDGTVAGTWRHDEGRIELDPFEPLAPAAVEALEREAKGLAALHRRG
jgi:hypothetical protein